MFVIVGFKSFFTRYACVSTGSLSERPLVISTAWATEPVMASISSEDRPPILLISAPAFARFIFISSTTVIRVSSDISIGSCPSSRTFAVASSSQAFSMFFTFSTVDMPRVDASFTSSMKSSSVIFPLLS